MYDTILFQGHGKFKSHDFHLGVLECKAYDNTLMDSKSQIDIDHLRQINKFYMAKKFRDMSWE